MRGGNRYKSQMCSFGKDNKREMGLIDKKALQIHLDEQRRVYIYSIIKPQFGIPNVVKHYFLKYFHSRQVHSSFELILDYLIIILDTAQIVAKYRIWDVKHVYKFLQQTNSYTTLHPNIYDTHTLYIFHTPPFFKLFF